MGTLVYGGLLLVLTGRYNEAPIAPPAGACIDSTAGDREAMPTVAAHVTEWLDDRREDIARSAAPYPVYLVAAEGGGIRAAYWSAGVLAALHDAAQGFNRHTLALSGVSGGAVGVGVYAALVAAAHERRVTGAAPLACATGGALQPCIAAIVGADLLSAPLAAMFLGDVWRSARSSPLLGPLASDSFPARAPLLERSLERAFREATGSDLLAQPFDAAWHERASRLETPLVISNMTNVATSDRALLTPLPGAGAWPGALDLGRRANSAQMPASTALVLSARFPGIGTTASLCGTRLVDGGYADNSGLASVAELLDVLLAGARARGLESRIQPVVLVIENGRRGAAEVNPATTMLGRAWRRLAAPDAMLGVVGDPLSTFGGMLDASPARYARSLAQRLAQFPHHRTERLALPWERGGEFPLGWSLSPHAAGVLDRRIDLVLRASSVPVSAAPAPAKK